MVDPMLMQMPGLERKHWMKQVTVANAPFQIATIAWTPPANAMGWLEKLILTNTNASAAVVNLWDQDVTSTGTVPPARGNNAAPLLPPINLTAIATTGANLYLGYDLCGNIELQGGITVQSTVTGVYIYAQWVEQIG